MTHLETTQTIPLTVIPDGTIRISGTRVNLEVVIHRYQLGATAEQIAHSFPTLLLADIHAVISYYLNHQPEVEAYLQRQAEAGVEIRRQIEASPYCGNTPGLRERLLARQRALQENGQNGNG